MPDPQITQDEPPKPAPAAATTSPPAATPKPDIKPKEGSLYSDLGEPEPGKEGSSSWPTTWREDMAAGDTKAADVLKRYQSPADMAKALLAAQQRIRSGEYKRAAPANAEDPEAMKAWRDEQGIPNAPDEYAIPALANVEFENLPENVKESIGAIRTTFHEANLTGDQGAKVAKAFTEIAEKQMALEAQADARNAEGVEDTLRAEWGAEFRPNLKMNLAHMEQAFGELTDPILLARTPDGRRLCDIPEFNKAINSWARSNGSDVIYDGEGGGKKSVAGRIEEIQAVMRTDFGKYQRELEPEYRRLLEEQEKRGKL